MALFKLKIIAVNNSKDNLFFLTEDLYESEAYKEVQKSFKYLPENTTYRLRMEAIF